MLSNLNLNAINSRTSVGIVQLNTTSCKVDENVDAINEALLISDSQIVVFHELCISSYNAQDNFKQPEFLKECIDGLIKIANCSAIGQTVIVGCPILFRSVLYNCAVVIHNQQIVYIRPKTKMANDGNHYETRWFTPWTLDGHLEHISICDHKDIPFGITDLKLGDLRFHIEICEERWAPKPIGDEAFLRGVHLIINLSNSHWKFQKMQERLNILLCPTQVYGGIICYCNSIGLDGERTICDGNSMVVQNGKLMHQCPQFSMFGSTHDEFIVDTKEVEAYRLSVFSYAQANSITHKLTEIDLPTSNPDFAKIVSMIVKVKREPIATKRYSEVDEVIIGLSLGIWDYLTKNGASRMILPLSGGADSACVLALQWMSIKLAVKALANGSDRVKNQINSMFKGLETLVDEVFNSSIDKQNYSIDDFSDGSEVEMKLVNILSNLIINTVYLPSEYSSDQTRLRAQSIASEANASFEIANISDTVSSLKGNKKLNFISEGGSYSEDIALQNMQARSRMVTTYSKSQMLDTRKIIEDYTISVQGWTAVFAAGNVCELLIGYMTKYDCSSGDFNPIGGINKEFIKKILERVSDFIPTLMEIMKAPPSAELRPSEKEGTYSQTDEDDFGMTYEELCMFGNLHVKENKGPFDIFLYLMPKYMDSIENMHNLFAKIKNYFTRFRINRHKSVVTTFSLFVEAYGPDDNRHYRTPINGCSQFEASFENIKLFIEDFEGLYK
jgi:NAD+ synthase (glutamine-hydrolysing)